MPLHSRVLSKDEELGKRDDDFRPKRRPTIASGLNLLRWRKRRLLLLVAIVGLTWVILSNLSPGLGSIEQRLIPPIVPGTGFSSTPATAKEPTGAPPRISRDTDEEEGKHYYNGQVKFFRLAATLHAISRTMGSRSTNRNVLFAASSLKSMSNLVPLACDMARWDRNYVHLALMGRDPLPLQDLIAMNGLDREDCSIAFHDARGDYSEYSSDTRLEISVAGAMKHIDDFMHPQVIITDDSAVEDVPFTRAMRAKGTELGKAVIEIPAGRYEQFSWMTRLDSGSLSNWFRPTLEILVNAPEGSSGALIRLLKSLYTADYAGLKPPRLTIELPSTIEPFARAFLRGFRWPPDGQSSPVDSSTLTLRHRIPVEHASSEQATLRFLESYYPASPMDNHVLVLSPQVEVSPDYLHYLQYALLEYRYASYRSPGAGEVLGISLEVPSMSVKGTEKLTLPTVADMNAKKYTHDDKLDQTQPSPFMYQAPPSKASLIFGDMWVTLHDFLSHRVTSSHLNKAEKTAKLVSETEPAWVEYLFELMRARGWYLLQPPLSFVTMHHELASIPEEYSKEKGDGQKGAEVLRHIDNPEEEPFLTADVEPVLEAGQETESFDSKLPMHEALPFNGDLPELSHLPFVTYTGMFTNSSAARQMKDDYVPLFRRQIGGCDAKDATRKRVMNVMRTDDLFCLPGLEIEFDDTPDLEPADVAAAIVKAKAPSVEEATKMEDASTGPLQQEAQSSAAEAVSKKAIVEAEAEAEAKS